MISRMIPSSGESLPVIGLGSWATFENPSDNLSNILTTFSEVGGKLIDTSPMYGNAENVIGQLTSENSLSDNFFYATKVWTTGKDAGIHQMESSSRKLNRKNIDLMQIHNLVDWKTHLKTLRDWKEAGKIRYIGITHYTVGAHHQLEEIIRSEKIDFVQFNYSISVRNAESSLLPAAKDHGVAVIINEPLDKGTLFKKVKETSLPGWAIEVGIVNWTAFFLKYILSHPAVTCVIPATSKLENLRLNLASGMDEFPDYATRIKMAKYWDSL